jgi:hypothetical protein
MMPHGPAIMIRDRPLSEQVSSPTWGAFINGWSIGKKGGGVNRPGPKIWIRDEGSERRTLFFQPVRFCLDYPSHLDYKERFNLCK